MIHREPPLSYIPYTNDDQNTNCRSPPPAPPRRRVSTEGMVWARRFIRCVTARRDTARGRARGRRSLVRIAAFVRVVVGSVRDRARERETIRIERERKRARAEWRRRRRADARENGNRDGTRWMTVVVMPPGSLPRRGSAPGCPRVAAGSRCRTRRRFRRTWRPREWWRRTRRRRCARTIRRRRSDSPSIRTCRSG